MNRKERRAAQKRGAPTMSPMAAMLADAFRAHQAGHRSDAERLYRDVLSAEPRNAAAMHLLGALMHQSGRSEEAISLIQQAIAIEPQDPDYRYNLGCILLAADRAAEAIPHLEKAVALKPGYIAAHFELANALARTDRLQEAEKNLRHVIELQPGNAELHNNLGLLLVRQGRHEDAMAAWQRALQLQPGLALAHFNIALANMSVNRAAEAEASLRRALEARPDYAEATLWLAVSLLTQGKTDEALRVSGQALAKQETNDTRATFVRCLLSGATFEADAILLDRLRRAVEEAWLQPYELAPLCVSVTRVHPVLGPAIRRVSEQWLKASAAQQHPVVADTEIAATAEPLFKAYLEATPNCDIDVERFLTAMRAHLLDRALNAESASPTLLNACTALARQCFVNEYIFAETPGETTRAMQIASIVQTAIRSGAELSPFRLAALAMYRPLASLEDAEKLLRRDWPAPIAALLRQQIAEPAEEVVLRQSMPKVTAIDEQASQQPCEQNARPRWLRAISTIEPAKVEDALRRRHPALDWPTLAPLPAPDVLIVGCGTGLPAIAAAQAYQGAKVLAVDPSAANLAYAKRQSASLNLSNLEFAQADILKLSTLGRSFDLIEAGSVLNNLADPFAGLQNLLSLLRAGGLIKVALHSEVGRGDVAAAREFAVAGNYQPDLEGIRLCRQAILRLPDGADARNILLRADFYSTSAFRDLVLNQQVHCTSLSAIRSFLADNNLEFSGLETSNAVRRAFATRFPDAAARKDLSAWHQFETENPDTFIAMYVLWLRKPVEA